MISEYGIFKAKSYCCEDISLIENYDKAMNDDNEKTIWICHHRLGIELNKTPDELKAMGLYENRPACELMFVTKSEHQRLHNQGKKRSAQTRANMSAAQKGIKKPKKKYLWLTPDGQTKIMNKGSVKQYHPDWILLKQVIDKSIA